VRILITGADQPLGRLAAESLSTEHTLTLTGLSPVEPDGDYLQADLREPDHVAPLVQGIDAILHLAPHAKPETPDWRAENAALDHAGRGTYVLLQETVKAGVQRIILASRLELMAAWPENYVVDETWKALPAANAAALAPFMAELTVREFVRAESILSVCLRLGDLGEGPDGTSAADAVAAIRAALVLDPAERKYRWWLYHICSTDRYSLGSATQAPLNFQRTEAAHAAGA
jgi:nucleoside-diphosphate-sugar epimerase